jgi:hypothetical protein
MRPILLLFFVLAGCSPLGEAYSERRAEIDLGCEDTGSECLSISILDVAFEREEDAKLIITNAGERALTVEVTVNHQDFSVSPTTASVSSDSQSVVTISFAPSSIDDAEALLVLTHNAGGPAIELPLYGTTDPDADDDGFLHELAPDGDDCNDFNATVNPAVDETWYDGVDQNCDAWSDYDQDRDGHDIQTRPDGDDCDDEDPQIHPGAPDPPKDEVDWDCDGQD